MKKNLLPVIAFSLLGCAVLFEGCKKEENPEEETTVNNTTSDPSTYFVKLAIDGTSKSYVLLENGFFVGFTSGCTLSGSTRCYGYGSYFLQDYPPTITTPSNENFDVDFDLSECLPFSSDLDSAFAAIFSIGDHVYNDSSQFANVIVSFLDDNGTVWDTRQGSQAGSSFKITSSSAGITQPSLGTVTSTSREIKAEFSCVLYDENGNSKNVTNGKLFLPYTELCE